jgi:hypothetical protein
MYLNWITDGKLTLIQVTCAKIMPIFFPSQATIVSAKLIIISNAECENFFY